MNTALLPALSLVGLVISSHFTAIAYRWIRADEKWLPSFCHLGEKTCASIVFTPRARVFGLPNSVLGQVFYAGLIVGTLTGILDIPLVFGLCLAASIVTVGLGLYLTYSLLFITRVPCKLCFTSHGINLAIFGLLLMR
jgi:uncharacterized membrane protein